MDLGLSRELPDMEGTFLVEEMSLGQTDRFARVMHLFEFRIDGVPININSNNLSPEGLERIEVLGVVGTILGKEGLFAQCGWFGNHDLDWFWCCFHGIRWISPARDSRFRDGELCVWFGTDLGDYALLLPHESYLEKWTQYLDYLGPQGPGLFTLYPPTSECPKWWRSKDSWPFTPTRLERPPSPMSCEDSITSNAALASAESGVCFCTICLRRDEKIAMEGIDGFEHQQWTWSDMESKYESELTSLVLPELSPPSAALVRQVQRRDINRKYLQLLVGAFTLFMDQGYWPIILVGPQAGNGLSTRETNTFKARRGSAGWAPVDYITAIVQRSRR